MSDRSCLECGKKVTGRADKKFCSDACRVAYHNLNKEKPTEQIRKVNRILHQNYLIMKRLNRKGVTKVGISDLMKEKFDFDHFTSIFIKKPEVIYYYCYDQGYLILGKTVMLVMKTKGGRPEGK